MPRNSLTGVEDVWQSIIYLYKQRLNIPESIYFGGLEEALLEIRELVEDLDRTPQLIKRPYSGVTTEIDLLIKLSRAIRYRMEKNNTLYVTGIDYLVNRIDGLISRLQRIYGYY
ncbi:MAG: hypothetical protein GSR81_04785 [Desulfurococcales archaeon]|nr:hypothetical protein [Desulfurococcales archaeon]